jgi:(1->4)-alpha-D-glucan 1-alpha-D-glucosylmutase
LLKLTTPGVPDIYQGNELWDFSLVDPDNRRPVDYERRRRTLRELDSRSPADLLKDWRSGAIKMKVTRDTLQLRAKYPDLFTSGTYEPLKVSGHHADRCVAFRRTHGNIEIIVATPRLTVPLGFPPIGNVWKNTRIEIPSGTFKNIFTNETVSAPLELSKVFAQFPLAVLVNEKV